jgi:hypothetical protein
MKHDFLGGTLRHRRKDRANRNIQQMSLRCWPLFVLEEYCTPWVRGGKPVARNKNQNMKSFSLEDSRRSDIA